MSGLEVGVRPTQLKLKPGQQYKLAVDVTNNGDKADHITVAIVGFPRDDITIRPPSEELFPGDSTSFRMMGTLPASYPPGTYALGVRAGGRADPDLSDFAEFELEVPDMSGLRLTLNPATLEKIRFKSKLFLRNDGPTPLDIELMGHDAEGQLHFQFEPEQVALPPGQDRLVRVRIRGRNRIAGKVVRRPFVITAQGPGQRRQVLGTFSERPLVPKRVWQGLAIVVTAAILIITLPKVIDNIVEDPTTTTTITTTTSATSTTTANDSSTETQVELGDENG